MKVRCVDNKGMEWLRLGDIYDVSECMCLNYKIEGHSVLKSRFEIVEDNMKEYTIQEVFEFENGTEVKLMESDAYYTKTFKIMKVAKNKCLIDSEGEIPVVSKLFLESKFTLVKKDKQVDFMEAIKAYDEGKEIYCKINKNEETKIIYRKKEGTITVLDFSNNGLSTIEILEGTWFIKEVV